MAKFQIGSGLDRYLNNLERLFGASDEIIGKAIYPGAGIVADAVRASISTIPDARYRWENGVRIVRGITPEQRAGLEESLGISRMRRDGSMLNVKVFFDGYNNYSTKFRPGGQPNQMIANACEAGSTYRDRTPFMSRAVNSAKAAAEEAIASELDKQLEKYSN